MFRCMGCMEEYDEEYEICPHCGYVRGTQANEIYHLQPETILKDRYIIGKVVGFGGFGVTYLAWDFQLERKVAIKEYFPNEFATRMPGQTIVTIFSGDKEEQFNSGCAKFEDEAKRLVKFHETPNIVTVYDTFIENRTAYIVMEYLEGKNLKEYLKEKGKLSVDEALEIMIPILEALCVVHAEGIIHRDIAPDNIFLCDDGSVKLIDFGASRFATTKHSKSLSVIMKPGYSPEEQYRSRGDQGPWTDVYSAAATFYKIITGVTPMDAMERTVKDGLKEPSKLGVKISKSIENSIMNALNVKIEGRTQTAEAFLADLRAEEVKRIKIKNKKMDVGRWPIWAKVSTSVASVAILGFMVLMATGIISFDLGKLAPVSLPEGKTRVPNVLNMSVEEASAACLDKELVLQVVDKDYSDVIPEGQVLRQSMMGGIVTDIVLKDDAGNEKNNTLGVVVSAGIKQQEVPDLYGYSEAKAQEMLEGLELDYIATDVAHIVAPNAIATQNLERETIAESGMTLQLTRSTGMAYNQSEETTVPDVVGKDEQEAASMLGDCGLYLSKVEMEYSKTTPKYHVISQGTESGTTLMKDSIVTVVVSLGGTVPIPDVQYKDEAEAVEVIEAAGLAVTIEYEDSDTVAKGKVIRQSMDAGSTVDVGTGIIIYISNGRDDAEIVMAEDVIITNEIQQQYDEMAKEDETSNNNFISFNWPKKEDTTTASTEVSTTELVASVASTTEAIVTVSTTEAPVNTEKNTNNIVVTTENVTIATTEVNTIATTEATTVATTEATTVATTEATTEKSSWFSKKTEEKKVTVPSVVGTAESSANSTLSDSGLSVSISYKHDEKTADRTVLTQSLPAGTEVSPGTSILIVVCNNQKKTQYSYRTVREETTTGSTNSMEGWTLYDTTMTWSDWSAWSDWSDSAVSRSDSREVQTRTMYQYRDYEDTSVTNDSSTYSMAGWNYLRTVKNEYGWVSKSSSVTGSGSPVPASSATLEVRNASSRITNYVYYHWQNWYANCWNVDSKYVGTANKDGKCHHHTSGASPLPEASVKYGDQGGNVAGECYYSTCPKCGFNIWWLDTGNSTYTYTWEQQSVNYTHYFDRWTDWSGWSTSAVSATDRRQVNTKTQYCYRDRSPIYTYHFKRTVYGDFSAWSDTAPSNTDGIEVVTREIYVY